MQFYVLYHLYVQVRLRSLMGKTGNTSQFAVVDFSSMLFVGLGAHL